MLVDEHLIHFERVAERVAENNLKVKIIRRCLVRPQVELLGHVESGAEVSVEDTKI